MELLVSAAAGAVDLIARLVFDLGSELSARLKSTR